MSKERLITAVSNSTDYTRTNITTKSWKLKQEEKNCADISSDKLAKSHTRRRQHENLLREPKSLWIVVENNAIRTNCFKSKIDSEQKNSKYRLCGIIDGMINHIISEPSKLAPKEFKTRHGRKGRWSTARDWNLTILPSGIYTTQIRSREWDIKFFRILRYNWSPIPG